MPKYLSTCLALSLTAVVLAGCESVTESNTDPVHTLAPENVVPVSSDVAIQHKKEGQISANGGGNFTVPPEEFGAEVGNVLTFNARKHDGAVSGHYDYQQTFMGEMFHFNGPVTCFNVYDGNRAKIGGLVQVSNDPTIPPGLFVWWSVFDNGQGNGSDPDESTIIGVGDEEENEAFCNSDALPRFGPWPLQGGNFQVDG